MKKKGKQISVTNLSDDSARRKQTFLHPAFFLTTARVISLKLGPSHVCCLSVDGKVNFLKKLQLRS